MKYKTPRYNTDQINRDFIDSLPAEFEIVQPGMTQVRTTPETDAFIVKMERIGVRISPEAIDHAKQLEQRCNGLAARVAELEGDEARLRFLADEPLVDQFGEIDLHEEAAINASAFGRDEPNSNDYLAAIRTAIDAARSK